MNIKLNRLSKQLLSISFLLSLLLGTTMKLAAHPHMYADYTLKVLTDDHGVSGIYQKWTFSRFFAQVLIKDYDEDQDGKFDKAEQENIYKESFSNLSKYYYFTHISYHGREYLPLEIKNFKVQRIGKKVRFSFIIPLHWPAPAQEDEFQITVYDITNYISFALRNVQDPKDSALVEYKSEIYIDPNHFSASQRYGQRKLRVRFKQSGEGAKQLSEQTGNFATNNPHIVLKSEAQKRPDISADNPFITKKQAIRIPDIKIPFTDGATLRQYELNRKISELGYQLKNNWSFSVIGFAFLIAFFYGILHALGPGHGKMIALSYFLSEKSRLVKGALFGFVFAFIHAGSAVFLVSALNIMLKRVKLITAENVSNTMQYVSYGLIVVLSLYLIISNVIELRGKKSKKEEESEVHGSKKNLFLMAATLGIIPCPGTLIMLLFFLSIERLYIGVFLSFFMALGMSITISIIGITAIILKNSSLKAVSLTGKNRVLEYFEYGIKFTGLTLVLVIGVSFFAMNILG